ncbi:MAG: phytoene/squalene synthase family protein [Halorientalis sp.]
MPASQSRHLPGDPAPASAPLAESKAIQQETGATFHLATRLLPERVRHPTYVLYAFFRVTDDVVDDPDPGSPADQRAALGRIHAAALGHREADDPVLRAVRRLVEDVEIPDAEFDAFVEAMARDVEASDYADHAELSTYLRGSSVAVANMLLEVMAPADVAAARPHARALAEAFQLTNFLRDVREDVRAYDRVYLPAASLAREDLTTDDVRALEPSPSLRRVIRHELRRTEELYREGVAGIQHLPDACQFGVLAAATLYAEHHRLIRARGFDTVSGRPSLSTARRLWVLARTWLAWQRTDDPETAFYRASAVPSSAESPVPVARRRDWPARLRAGSTAGLAGLLPWVGE